MFVYCPVSLLIDLKYVASISEAATIQTGGRYNNQNIVVEVRMASIDRPLGLLYANTWPHMQPL